MADAVSRDKMIIPPYAGVRLVEYWDRLELVPVEWYRNFVGLGRFKANKVGFQPGEILHSFFNAIFGAKEIWVVVNWKVFESGREELGAVVYCDPKATVESAKKKYLDLIDYLSTDQEELNRYAKLTGDSIPLLHRYADQKTEETKETLI
jgi:hypothetical protein